jgi:PKD repeat protein
MRRSICAFAVLGFGALALPAVADNADVTFQCCAYSPSAVRILPGEKLTITPDVGVTFDQHPLHYTDGVGNTLSGPGPAERTFPDAGVYAWYCGVHGHFDGTTVSGMSGHVSVTTNHPPVAGFTATATSVASGTEVSFDASSSTDPDAGQTITYSWDLDGNGTDDPGVTTTTPSFTYTNTGTAPRTVTVRLRATDDNSDAVGPEATTATKTITVAPAGGTTPPPGGGGGGGTPPPGGGTTPADTTPPVVGLKLAKSLAAGTSLRIAFTTSEPGSAKVTLRFANRVLAAHAAFAAAGKHTLTIKLSKAARRTLRRRRTARLTLVVADAAGNRRTLTRTVKLRAR